MTKNKHRIKCALCGKRILCKELIINRGNNRATLLIPTIVY